MKLKNFSEVELQYQVEKLLANYVECIDDDRLESWPDFFVDKCLYKVISQDNVSRDLPAAAMFCDSRGMLVDRIVSLRNANVYAEHSYRHVLSNVNIKSVEEDGVTVQSNYMVLQTRNDGATKLYNSGKYLDKIVLEDDGFKFKEKVAIFDTHRIDSLMVTPI